MADSTMDIFNEAYRRAWSYVADNPDLTPDERLTAPRILRQQIERQLHEGRTDPALIAHAAMGYVRAREQLSQSMARVTGRTAGQAQRP
jgi:ABC-type iron transport system FetAB ATPase subunit